MPSNKNNKNDLPAKGNGITGADTLTSKEKIIVIGASTGGINAIKSIIKNLPPDFRSPIFIVWHMSPDIEGVIAQVLNRSNSIYAANAYNNEEIKSNRIYIAPPDN